MTKHSQSIPEPLFPEHQLLSNTAPEVELSANFRSRVLGECAASRAMAQKVLAAKFAAAALLLILAAAVAYRWWHQEPNFQPQLRQMPATSEPISHPNPISTSNSPSTPAVQQPIPTIAIP